MDKKCNIRNQAALDYLNARFEARLKTRKEPGVHRRVDALFEARGKITGKRPIAGPSF